MTPAASATLETVVERRHLFGIPVSALTIEDTLDLVEQAIRERRPLMLGVVNAAKVVNMGRDEALRDAVLSSDLILADGASVVLAARLLGQRLPGRVAGIDLMMGMLARASASGYRVFCLGATEEVVQAVCRVIAERFPGARVVGTQHGYFTEAEEPRVAEAIRMSRADMLFVAMTSPKKERFLRRWSGVLEVPVCHGVGGAFDVLAGKVRRAPLLWQRLGLEWLYRVKQEPRRLWRRYLVTNSLFVGLVVRELLRPGRRGTITSP
jgi:N-acetylglucosaminyldiphosphoundecaprenol N-acetyl-beta-D-mannosaminyltransferase